MKISEMFRTIQGEGRYAGLPVSFIRISGCNRNCSFCDTKYHKEGREFNLDETLEFLFKSKDLGINIVVITGGEPLMHYDELAPLLLLLLEEKFILHLETNGDFLLNEDLQKSLRYNSKPIFQYISTSPKDYRTASKIRRALINVQYKPTKYDIKIVVDEEVAQCMMVKHATMLMPLTTDNEARNRKIEQIVWDYCITHNKKFCLRQHIHVWGNSRLK